MWMENSHKLIFEQASGQICTNIFQRSLNMSLQLHQMICWHFLVSFYCPVSKEIQNNTFSMQFNNVDRCFRVALKNLDHRNRNTLTKFFYAKCIFKSIHCDNNFQFKRNHSINLLKFFLRLLIINRMRNLKQKIETIK